MRNACELVSSSLAPIELCCCLRCLVSLAFSFFLPLFPTYRCIGVVWLGRDETVLFGWRNPPNHALVHAHVWPCVAAGNLYFIHRVSVPEIFTSSLRDWWSYTDRWRPRRWHDGGGARCLIRFWNELKKNEHVFQQCGNVWEVTALSDIHRILHFICCQLYSGYEK